MRSVRGVRLSRSSVHVTGLIVSILFGIPAAIAIGVGLYAYLVARQGKADPTVHGNIAMMQIGLKVMTIGGALALISIAALIVRAL